MAGRPVVAEVMAGAGAVSEVAAELQAAGGGARRSRARRRDGRAARALRRGAGALRRAGRLRAGGAGARDPGRPRLLAGDAWTATSAKLSGGWKMRVALARILLMRPDAMLLDEPSNHLDLESLIWLENFLQGLRGRAADDLARSRVHEPHRRPRSSRSTAACSPATRATSTSTRRQRALNEAQAQAAFERQQAMLAKEMRFIERFKAQAAKASQVQSRVKKLDKIEKVEPPKRRKTLDFEFPPCPRSGEDVVAHREACTRATARASSTTASTCRSAASERWAVMGVNGAGKSTLLKLIAGETAADAGSVTVGRQRQMGYFAQHAMELLDPDAHRLRDRWRTRSRWPTSASLQDAGRVLRVLGGRRRQDLPRAVRAARRRGSCWRGSCTTRPNFLVLDEPTNHLDIATKDMIVRVAGRLRGHDAVRVPRPAVPGPAVEPRARAGARRPHPVRRRIHRIRRPQRPRSARLAVDCERLWRKERTP